MLSFLVWRVGWEFFLPYKICKTLSAVDTSHNNQMILTPPLASLSFKSHLPSEHNLLRVWKWFPLRQRQAVSQAPALQVINTSGGQQWQRSSFRSYLGNCAVHSGWAINKFPLADECSLEPCFKISTRIQIRHEILSVLLSIFSQVFLLV